MSGKKSLLSPAEAKRMEMRRSARRKYWSDHVVEEDGLYTGTVPLRDGLAASLALDYPDRNQTPLEMLAYRHNTRAEERPGKGRMVVRGRSFMGYEQERGREREDAWYGRTRDIFEQESGVGVFESTPRGVVKASGPLAIPPGSARIVETRRPGSDSSAYSLAMNAFNPQASMFDRTWRGLQDWIDSDPRVQGTVKGGWYIPPE